MPAWVVHGERGDGGITDRERHILEGCSQMNLITIPGASYFTPNEEPALVAGLVIQALGRAHRTSLTGQAGLRATSATASRGICLGRVRSRTSR